VASYRLLCKNDFLRTVKHYLSDVPLIVDTHGYPSRPVGSHPDDIDETPGPPVTEALEGVWKVINFLGKREDFVTKEQLGTLHSIMHAISVVYDQHVSEALEGVWKVINFLGKREDFVTKDQLGTLHSIMHAISVVYDRHV
jgi:hypothetical protein